MSKDFKTDLNTSYWFCEARRWASPENFAVYNYTVGMRQIFCLQRRADHTYNKFQI